jgi:hypothetical protein
MDLKSEPRPGRCGHPTMIGLRSANGDQRLSPFRYCLCTQVFEFAGLIATHPEPGQVIAFYIQLHPALQH